MKKNDNWKKSRTIADLKFDWRITRKAHDNLFIAQDKILGKNPHISGLKVIPGIYEFQIHTSSFNINVENYCLPNVFELFEYICFLLSARFSITGKFSHFERIDDLTYRIHMKK